MNTCRHIPRTLSALLLAAALITGGCSGVTEAVGGQVDKIRQTTQDVGERTRFCLAAAGAASQLRDASPAEAGEILQELVDKAPAELRDDAAGIEDLLRRAAAGDAELLNDPSVARSIDQLQRQATEICDPRS